MNGTVSIIVPVYNVEPYLPRCVDSLVTQTYPHLEILLVNDGSADQSGEICDAYAARDSRVHAFHKANGGAADARNFGLDHMTGAYLMFLDADDWLDPTCVENCMMEFMSDFAPTCVMFPYVREFPSTGKAVYILGEKRLEISGDVALRKIRRRFFGLVDDELWDPVKLEELNSPGGKVYPATLVEGLRFHATERVMPGEDCLFNAKLFFRIDRIVYRPDIFYRYRRNENSTVHTYHANLVAVTAHLHRLLRTYIVDQQLDEDFNKALDNRIVLCLLNLMRNVLRAPVSLSERVDMARKILSDEEHKPFLQSFPLECLSLKWRLYYWLCRREYAIGALLMTYAAEKLKKYLR